MNLTELVEIFPYAVQRASKFIDPLNETMEEFGISTPMQQAAFLAQVGHESGQLRYLEEIASGAAYEGRSDLGNTEEGDGVRFKGRGLIQITGRDNYKKVGDALGYDFISDPDALSDTDYATRSAGWFWQTHNLNMIADNCIAVTKKVNGGTNGLADREALFEKAKQVLGA